MEAMQISNNKAPSNGDSWSDSLSMWDYEVAELTWQNGQPGMHGLSVPKQPATTTKSPSTKPSVWDRPAANGTLECVVNQGKRMPKAPEVPQLRDFPCFSDAMVPCSVSADASPNPSSWVSSKRPHSQGGPSDGAQPSNFHTTAALGSGHGPFSNHHDDIQQLQHRRNMREEHSDQSKRQRLAIVPEISHSNANRSISGSENPVREDTYATCDTGDDAGGITTPVGSVENTSTAKDEQDSVCHSRSKMESHSHKGKGYGRCSSTSKRSRAAAVHNQSERKRRDRINQKMKALQKLLPNSNKTDKASVLDEVIEYLKQLQATVQLMGQTNTQMMMPLPMQQLQLCMLAQMGMNAGIRPIRGGVPQILSPCNFVPQNLPVVDAGSSDRPKETMSSPSFPDPGPSTLFPYQTQNMNLDPFKMAAIYQQMYQYPSLNSHDLGKP